MLKYPCPRWLWDVITSTYRSHLYDQVPVSQLGIKSRHAVTEHSSPLKQLAITISMSFNMKTLVLWTALSLLATCEGLKPDLPVKACQEEFSSVFDEYSTASQHRRLHRHSPGCCTDLCQRYHYGLCALRYHSHGNGNPVPGATAGFLHTLRHPTEDQREESGIHLYQLSTTNHQHYILGYRSWRARDTGCGDNYCHGCIDGICCEDCDRLHYSHSNIHSSWRVHFLHILTSVFNDDHD